jgi:hypothetical protein
MPGAYNIVEATFHALANTLDNFKSGHGMEWGDHHPCLFDGTERFVRAGYNTSLIGSWLPALDGVDDRVLLGVAVTRPCTTALWVNRIGAGSGRTWVYGDCNTFGGLLWNQTYSCWICYSTDSAHSIYPAGPAATNVWWHFAETMVGSTRQLYANGIAGSSDAYAYDPTALVLGSRLDCLDTTWPGLTSSVMRWNRALSGAEIAALADPSNALLSGLILPVWKRVYAAAAAAPPAGNRRRRVLMACGG